MTELPPHIANAPTPRTDAEWQFFSERGHINHDAVFSYARQLEREQQWAMEVIEKLRGGCRCNWSIYDEQGTVLFGGGRLVKQCSGCTAYNELKKYMEEKKGEVKG